MDWQGSSSELGSFQKAFNSLLIEIFWLCEDRLRMDVDNHGYIFQFSFNWDLLIGDGYVFAIRVFNTTNFQFSFNWDLLIVVVVLLCPKCYSMANFQFSFNWDVLIDCKLVDYGVVVYSIFQFSFNWDLLWGVRDRKEKERSKWGLLSILF